MITTRQIVNANEVRDLSGEVLEAPLFWGNGGAVSVQGGAVTGTTVGFNGNSASGNGGAVSVMLAGTVSLVGASFTGNGSLDYGGAYYDQSNSVFSVVNSEFMNNRSYMGGAISEGGSLTATGCVFGGNMAKAEAKPGQGEADYYGSGGAIEVRNGGSARISGSTFSGNTAAIDGGAVCKSGAAAGDVLTIQDSLFSGNVTGALNHEGKSFGDGGAVAVKAPSAHTEISGSVFEENRAQRCGGAVDNDQRSFVEVQDSTFTANIAGLDAGALRNCGTASISGSTFDGNQSGGDAGAVQNIKFGYDAVMDIDDCVFTGNGSGWHAGALANGNAPGSGGALTVEGSTFTENSSIAEGGAAANFGTLTVKGCDFIKNRSAASAGALVNFAAGSASVSGSAFKENISEWLGGAVYTEGNANVSDTLFDGNRAILGGAVGVHVPLESTVSISGCTFTGNYASSEGGAIYNFDTGTLEISGSSFSGNSAAGEGGALLNVGTVKLKDTGFLQATDTVCNATTLDGQGGRLYFSGANTLNSRLYGSGTSYSEEETRLAGVGTVSQLYIAQGYATAWDGVKLDATLIGGKVGDAVDGVKLSFHDVAMSGDSLVFGAGECAGSVIDMSGNAVSLDFTGTGTREKAYIYAGGHADGGSITVGDVSVTCSVAGDMGVLWGGALLENGGSFAADRVRTEIGGGNFLSYVGNGCKTSGGSSAVNTEIGATFLSISGGSFANLVYAGGYSNGNGVTVGSSTLEISGGTFDKSVFGGNGANSNANGTNTTITGDVTVTVDAREGIVSFRGNLYAGSMGEGEILGSTTMTFKGNGENLSFSAGSYVSGGSKLAYHYAYAQKTFVKGSADRDARFLVFDGFSGEFGANMNNGFSNVSFVNGSSGVEFTAGNVDLRYTKVWDFEIGGTDAILSWEGGMNDFAGDSINLSFADGCDLDSPAVLLAGDAGTLSGWRKADITLGGSAMTDADGDGIFTGSCGGADYRLYEDAKHRLVLAIA